MTNRKNTRRALVLSLLSLLLCCSMLVGTTFAWFTDSVTSGNNRIIAGNLDIELDYSMNLTDWDDVTDAGDIFVAPAGATKGLWEPGHTEVAYLRVTNAGTLALKYQLQVNPYTETTGTSVNGDEIKLSEILKFVATEPSTTALTAYTRETAQAAAMASTGTKLTEYDTNVITMAPGEVQYIALVVYMPEEVGNEANYRGENIPTIEFALNLQATQVEAEIDSFGDDYDKDSAFSTDVSTLAELEEAVARGGIINVLADITSENGVTITKDTVLKLNGNTLTATGERAYMLNVEGNADLTVIGGKLVAESTNGVVDGTGTSTGASSSVYFKSTGKLTMKDVEIEGSVRGGHRAVEVYGGSAVLTNVDIVTEYGSGVNAGSGASVVLNNCDIHVTGMYSQPYNSVCFSVMGGAQMTINSGSYKLVNNNTYVTGDTHGGWVGIVMSSGGTLTTKGGTYTNVPAAGFNPQYERAIIEAENNAPAVATLNLLGGTFDPQEDQVYGGYGDQYYPVYNVNLKDNGDGTWTAYIPAASTVEDLTDMINSGEAFIELAAGTYKMPSISGAKEFTISGTKDTVIDLTMGAYMDAAKVSFEGVTIKGSTGMANGNGSDYAALYSPNVTYTDCTFVGPFRIGRDGATFIGCTFTNLGNDYVWTYGNDCTFEGCTFETEGKSLLIYSDGGSEVSKVTVKDCVFNATKGAKAGAIANQNCAAIEIHNYGNGVDLTTSGNTYGENFSGEWRIKTYEAGKPAVFVNGIEYTTIAIDGKLMTIDANKNVTVQ